MRDDNYKASLDRLYKDCVSHKSETSDLYVGELGILIFLLEYQKYFNIDDDLSDRVDSAINKALSMNSATISNGLTGLGWFLEYLVKKDFIDKISIEELQKELDDVIYEAAFENFKKGDHDFMHGGSGNFYYLLGRAGESPELKPKLNALLDELDSLHVNSEIGYHWTEIDNSIPEYAGKVIVNSGLAHGIAGKILLLTHVIRAGINVRKAKKMLEDSIGFIVKLYDEKSRSQVPVALIDYQSAGDARLAWCQGDLGISYALHIANNFLQDPNLKRISKSIARQTTTRRTRGESSVMDAGFCHGSAGIAHLYLKIFRLTQDQEMLKSGRYWLDYTINFERKNNGIMGYAAWDNVNMKPQKEFGLLRGHAGIGLVYLSYLSGENTIWDSSLLL